MSANIQSGRVTADISGAVQTAVSFVVPSATQTIVVQGSGKASQTCTAGTGINCHTVTATKTFYLTQFTIGNQSDAAAYMWCLRDSAVGGTLKLNGVTPATSSPIVVALPTPVAFTASVWLDINTTKVVNWCLTGFEQ